MKMKRFLALALALSMLASLALNVYAVETEEPSAVTENLVIDALDGSEVDVDLIRDDLDTSDVALDPEVVDAAQEVSVIIVMEGDSIVEEDSAAVMDAQTQAKAEALEENQAEVVAQIEEEVLDGEALDVSYNYTWLLNGVAAKVPYGAIEDIRAIDGVKQVLLQPRYEICENDVTHVAAPQSVSDGVMIGRESAWANGYTGKGIKIAVIDTGLDTTHQNFQAMSEDKLTADSATAQSVAAVLDQLNASDRYSGLTVDDVYYNNKVVFGFNYSDDDLNVSHNYDQQSDHGTHVAGIAAANKVEGSEVVGVAPDAQLYVMKVFGVTDGGSAGDILAALEDALILGADVVNMSLGSEAGFTSDSEEINAIYNRVAETNTVLSVSAGNATTSAVGNNWGTDANLTMYPDNGIVGAPGTYVNVLSVASVENWKVMDYYIDADGYQIGYQEGSNGSNESVLTLTGAYELVVIPGYGAAADFEGLDLTGKIALVQRGVESFETKHTNAANAGAVACLVYNNTTGVLGMDLNGSATTIPCASITLASGEYLLAALEENPELTISFPSEQASIPSESAYQMSDFSSWGVAPDLSLEPDITAPGGNIYSTTNNGTYGLMSGTSMAAPNISGMSALVMQYVRENFDAEKYDYRTLVRDLLMSTSVPLTADGDLFYSPRSQGSGLANAFNAVTTQVYLTVDGSDTAKVQLGDDENRTGAYSYTFNVNNFGSSPAFYDLNTVAQTEDYVDYGEIYFMSSTPKALGASITQTSDSMVLRYDVDNNGSCWSHDAYLIYRAAIGEPEDRNWENEAFRYDLNKDDAAAKADVQAYLDELVGKDAGVDLDEKVLMVAAGETAQVSVSLALTAGDKEYLDTIYTNGGYVEGFTFLTALNKNGVDLSLPYLGFYGDWNDAPVLDNGNYWDALLAEEGQVVGNQYPHILFTEAGSDAYGFYPGFNFYLEEAFDVNHISLSPNGDMFVDTISDMYISLLRNASALTFRYTNTGTGEVYHEVTLENVSKSYYEAAYGQIVPFVYTWIDPSYVYDWKTPAGEDLTNNTKLLLEVEAVGVADSDGAAETETWAVPITIDLEAPALLNASRTTAEDGTTTLELTFRDNLSVSVAALLSSDGSTIYAMETVEDVEPDENGYQNYTKTFDITGIEGKLMIILSDYALNEAYYGINLAGGAYGDLVAFQYNYNTDTNAWVSFDADVNLDETQIFMADGSVVAAEYVNGYVYAQTETGAMYGFRYEDMLADSVVLNATFVAQLENVYQDLAYSYGEGKLYGLYVYEDGGYPTTEIHSINLKGEYYDENMWSTVAPYQEDWTLGRGGLYGLTLASDDAGSLYVLGLNYDWDTEALGETAHLWTVGMEYDEWSDSYMLGYALSDLGDTGLSMDYLQSMTWDHNAEKLYWARFDAVGTQLVSELYEVNPATAEATKVGTLSGETWALFAPLTAENAAKPEHANVPDMDSSVVGTPVLRDEVITMNVGGTKTLGYDFEPWYTAHKDVVWSSSNTDVVAVDENGTITAVGAGSAVVTVTAAGDETKFDTVEIQVSALDLKIQGIISAQTAGLGNVTGVSTYEYEMVNGVPTFATVNQITASEELNYGLSLATSAYARGSIWASEYGNTGMLYEIDAATGEVKDALQPINGNMLFGMTYSESQDTFTGIMNMYLHVDQPFNHWAEQEIINSYDEELHDFNWRRVNMLPYLLESNTGFVTNETGQGASSEIVFCGITTIDGGLVDPLTGESYYYDTYKDYMGNWAYGGSVNYQPTQTLVLLDNVGRLWYIDEIVGMSKTEDEWGTVFYNSADGATSIQGGRNGLFDVEIVDEDGNVSYSVFYIRQLVETPLTDMFREGTMPRITYHFSDIEFGGYTADGDPIFAMSLYDYWNNGTTNELYLYVPGHETDEMDYETWEPIRTPDRMFTLGDTGEYNIIASIHALEVTGGLDAETGEENAEAAPQAVNKLAAGVYGG